MSSEGAVTERVAALKRLYAAWETELEQIAAHDPERARHHAEALLDLQNLIRQLENDRF